MIGFLKEKPNGIKQKGFDIMKNIKKYSSLILIFTLILALNLAKSSEVEAIEGNNYRHIWKEHSLINSSENLEKFFHVTENMDISEFTINLKIKASPTLIEDLSSISILVNNMPVHSLKIQEVNKSGFLSVKLPENLIKVGRNSILIKGFLKSSKDKCEYNPDINWLIIEKDSFINFKVHRKDSEYIKDIFENTFYSDGLKGHVQLALADEILEENYSQLSSLAALLGYVHRDKEVDLKINLLKYSDLKESKKETILLGNTDQVKNFNKDLLTQEEWNDAKENGFIGLIKIGEKSHFLLLVSDDEQLQTLLAILGNQASLDQIKDKNYLIDKSKLMDKSPYKTKASLKDLGYESFSQSGSGIKEFNYFLSLPANQSLGPDNNFDFQYKYSSLIEEDNAYVTVEINGKKLLSKKLPGTSDSDNINFSIPAKYFDQTGFNISLKFNLAPEEENCIGKDYDDLWLDMETENSFFDLSLKERKDYSLLNAQGLLQDCNGSLDTIITIDDYENLSLDSIANISSYLGRLSQGVSNLSIKKLNQAPKENGAIIGLALSPLLKSEKQNFQINISDQGELMDQNFFIQNTKSIGIISLSLDNSKLFITATDKRQLKLTIDKFPTSQGPNTSLILKDDQIIESFKDLEKTNQKEETRKINKEILLSLLVLLGFTTIVFFLYYKKIR